MFPVLAKLLPQMFSGHKRDHQLCLMHEKKTPEKHYPMLEDPWVPNWSLYWMIFGHRMMLCQPLEAKCNVGFPPQWDSVGELTVCVHTSSCGLRKTEGKKDSSTRARERENDRKREYCWNSAKGDKLPFVNVNQLWMVVWLLHHHNSLCWNVLCRC